MKRVVFGLLTALALVVATGLSSPAQAASPHFKRGGTPTCTISGSGTASTSTTCTGTLAGLGNEDLLLETEVEGFAVYQCQNPGGNIAPGQNKVLVGPVTEPTLIDSDAIKNGTLRFTTNPAVLTAPKTVSGQQAGCPGVQWTGVNPTLTLTSIALTIRQGAGNTLLFTCSASNPNGLSGTVPLAC